ncbi:DcrB-related protein [Kosakonia oryzae]|uniref:DcrB-related protein n=1 Tax=Kosakonia oryzae TaxID=497725 RepID=UPI001D07F3A2|nr:DcrB-related protein [Kosakonia oryzae]UDJ84552.1 DcrB-related protein [Kosakonia oryzae]
MADYILQEATLALPDVFKDRTMNLFTLNDNGASEFTFVVSRASAKKDENIQAVAARILREMEITVPQFQLHLSRPVTIDGEPAIELYYQFKSDGALIFQRQTVVLLNEQPTGKKIVCYIGTCPDEFSDYYQRQYQEIIQSIKFHRERETEPEQMLQADDQRIFFALDTETKHLSAFEGIQALYQHLPLQRAREGAFLLYAQDGQALKIAPVPGSQPVRYALWTHPEAGGHNLGQQLSICRTFAGVAGLDSAEDVRRFLAHGRDGVNHG